MSKTATTEPMPMYMIVTLRGFVRTVRLGIPRSRPH